jgi:xanthine/uracil permease
MAGGGSGFGSGAEAWTMKRTVIRASRITFGVSCLVLGVVGLFVPFLQGILFMVIGLSLLSRESEYARRGLQWLRGLVGRERSSGPGRQGDGRE